MSPLTFERLVVLPSYTCHLSIGNGTFHGKDQCWHQQADKALLQDERQLYKYQ